MSESLARLNKTWYASTVTNFRYYNPLEGSFDLLA
jgi:hypothetical protein